MKAFSQLYQHLEAAAQDEEKTQVLEKYFKTTAPEDAVWALHLLLGNALSIGIKIRDLQVWCQQSQAIPDWLFNASYQQVGDVAETIALLCGDSNAQEGVSLHQLIEQTLLPLRTQSPAIRQQVILTLWSQMDVHMRFVLHKIMTSGLHIPSCRMLLSRAIAQAFQLPHALIAYRIEYSHRMQAEQFTAILQPDLQAIQDAQTYTLAYAPICSESADTLGIFEDWISEWKWTGLRAQFIHRKHAGFIWSEQTEVLNDKFPELMLAMQNLPVNCVLDIEIVAWENDAPLPLPVLEKRLKIKRINTQAIHETPVIAMISDLLEYAGEDIRHLPLIERRKLLLGMQLPEVLKVSDHIPASNWQELVAIHQQTHQLGVEGMYLKRKNAPYPTADMPPTWWQWKRNAYRIHAVLLYAQRAEGTTLGAYQQYTFGVWQGDQLVGIAKCSEGLHADDKRELNAYIKTHKLAKLGPVVTVSPERVYEIEFEEVYASSRHKLGLTVRHARILRSMPEINAVDADTIETVRAML